jgi:hypothetical protein
LGSPKGQPQALLPRVVILLLTLLLLLLLLRVAMLLLALLGKHVAEVVGASYAAAAAVEDCRLFEVLRLPCPSLAHYAAATLLRGQ